MLDSDHSVTEMMIPVMNQRAIKSVGIGIAYAIGAKTKYEIVQIMFFLTGKT